MRVVPDEEDDISEDLEVRDARPLPVMGKDGGAAQTTWRTADALAKSGYFKDAKQATQAFAKILAGRDLGLSAFEAMSALHVIEGKIEASADLQASRVKASAKYDYRGPDWLHVESGEIIGCRLTFFEGTPNSASPSSR